MEIPEAFYAPGVIVVVASFVVLSLLYILHSGRRSSRKTQNDKVRDDLRNLGT
ncbi:MAG: hypothetical protein R3D68_17230 [Hyphomicrobiaceae bacterium]